MSTLSSGSITRPLAAIISPSASPANDPALDPERTRYLSSTISSLIASAIPVLALLYFAVLFCYYRYAQRHPRLLSKASSVYLQRYVPVVYALLVFTGLVEVALASWLLLQYRFNMNYPNIGTRLGVRLLLFSASWTTSTAAINTFLFLHPIWSTRPISSVGVQAIWIFITWIFWVVGAAIVNAALPRHLIKGGCTGLVYCGQLRTLYALSVLEIVALSGSMIVVMWLAWPSTRKSVHPVLPS